MSRLLQAVDLPLFVRVSTGAIDKAIDALVDENLSFRRALLLHGPGATLRAAQRVADSLRRGGVDVHLEKVSSPTFGEVDRIQSEVVETFFPGLVIGVGGGSVLDVSKLVGAERRLPWISVPTVLSNDGFCSPVVVLFNKDRRKSVAGSMPIGVIADLGVLSDAPEHLTLAGVGDLISNITACADWEMAASRGKAAPHHLAKILALSGARHFLAAASTIANREEMLTMLFEGLLLSGVSMAICGTSRPCSGSEHLVSHALDEMGHSVAPHGVQVGLATQFCLLLHQGDVSLIHSLVKNLLMPSSPEKIGLTRECFLTAVEKAPDMRPGRWTILSDCSGNRRLLEEAYDTAFPGA